MIDLVEQYSESLEEADMGKKLWLLRPNNDLTEDDNPWSPRDDKCFGMVIRAKTEEEARKMSIHGDGNEVTRKKNPWLDAAYSSCEVMTTEGAAGVIITNFHNS